MSGLSLGYSGPNTDTGALDAALTGVYANTGSAAAFAAGRMSMECWLWQYQNLPGAGTYLSASNGANLFGLFRNGTQWGAIYNNTSALFAVNYSYQVWHHLVMTYDLVNVSLYVDGTVRATAVVAASLAFNSVFAIATNLALANWGQAFISEVAVYNTTLSAARVTAHYTAADNVGAAPTFKQSGVAPVAGAGGAPLSTLQAEILASVRKTY
jgi:hypothetical protein